MTSGGVCRSASRGRAGNLLLIDLIGGVASNNGVTNADRYHHRSEDREDGIREGEVDNEKG